LLPWILPIAAIVHVLENAKIVPVEFFASLGVSLKARREQARTKLEGFRLSNFRFNEISYCTTFQNGTAKANQNASLGTKQIASKAKRDIG
jgi:hypothetical protein